ncbi:MAG: hypothetical protein IT428_15940 [Planctomycetaceae bacterium]|nr:hypothetical protein [Planctomycetaceae bacterium]
MNDRSRPIEEQWEEYFTKNDPSPAAVRRAVNQLHAKRLHEHVIACIQAAIIQGKARPWMYEVLALSMEIAGRPKEEVERVLLSRVDFNGSDVASMIYSAAYLVRFGGERQALKLYRQASQIDPTRPEPYTLGLKLAIKAKDHEAIRWATTGILTNVWSEGYEDLHRQAENAAADSRKELMQAERTSEVEALDRALSEAHKQDLIVRLTWAGEGDLDLIVDEPQGTVCSFENPRTRGGGILVHDGFGPASKNTWEEYRCPFGFPGDYRLRIRHIGGNVVGKRASLTITQYRGSENEVRRTFTVPLDEQDKSIRIPLAQGRRKDFEADPQKNAAIGLRPVRTAFNPRLRGRDRGQQLAANKFHNSRDRNGRIIPTAGAETGYQPIVNVIPEGITMRAMASISADRRYVRISTQPLFQSIADVFTFTFNGTGSNGGTPVQNGAGN